MAHRRGRDSGFDAEGGFTIVEVMVALSLMAVAMVAISGVFFTGLKAAGASATRTSGVALATRETEAIRAVPYAEMGFYDTQAERVPTFETLPTVSLGTTVPAAVTPRIEPAGSATVGPVPYAIRRHVLWVGSTGPGGATYPEAYKKTVVVVTWTDGSGPHTVRQDSIVYPGGRGVYAGPGSTGATTATTVATVAPTAPTLTAVSTPVAPAGESQLSATWAAPSAGGVVTHYIVQWSTNSSFTAGVAASPQQPATATTYQATGLAAGTTYYFRVIAYAGSSLPSPPSNELSGSTLVPTVPPPCGVSGLNVTGLGTGANQGLSTKTYLQNGNNRLQESFSLVVTYVGPCNAVFTVRGVAPGDGADPGSPYATSGDSAGSDTGTIGATATSWSVGVHTFTVLRDGVPVSPAVQKTFLFCGATAKKSSNPNQC